MPIRAHISNTKHMLGGLGFCLCRGTASSSFIFKSTVLQIKDVLVAVTSFYLSIAENKRCIS